MSAVQQVLQVQSGGGYLVHVHVHVHVHSDLGERRYMYIGQVFVVTKIT